MNVSSVTSAVVTTIIDPLVTKNRRRQLRRANGRRKAARSQGATLYELLEELDHNALTPAQMHGRAKCARKDTEFARRRRRDTANMLDRLDRRSDARDERLEDESLPLWEMTSDSSEVEDDALDAATAEQFSSYIFGCMGNMQAACASDHQVLISAQNGTYVLYPGAPAPHRVDEYADGFAREHTFCTPHAVTVNGTPLTAQEMDRILSWELPTRRLPGGPAGYPTRASVCFEGKARGGTKRHDLAWKTEGSRDSMAR